MSKTPRTPADSPFDFRALPSVERVLASAAFEALIAEFGRPLVKDAVVAEIALLRHERRRWEEESAAASIRDSLLQSTLPTLRRVINGSGVIIHTNLGRSPIDPVIWVDAADVVSGYSNLEFDLARGERGARDEHLSALCYSLFGCEAALLVNNNAAGALLVLASLAAGREVIVSRGELVEIGGSFRVPDVISQGGAKLREVGTTNRTRAADYADAAGRRSAAILRVHRSNFDIVGFTETPSIAELVEVAQAKRLPLVYDEGSGRVVDLARYGFASGATIRSLFDSGVSVITCSTDKLIGATQGGLILGSEELVARCRRHPLMRALRTGKETYAVIAATLRAFVTGRHERDVAIYRMLALDLDQLRTLAAALAEGTSAEVIESRCALGGGTTPTETIPSIAVALRGDPNALQSRFLAGDPPIVGRIADDRFSIEVRTLSARDRADVRRAIAAAG